MNYSYKQVLEHRRKQLRDNLIRAEWECMNELAEIIRQQIKDVEKELETIK